MMSSDFMFALVAEGLVLAKAGGLEIAVLRRNGRDGLVGRSDWHRAANLLAGHDAKAYLVTGRRGASVGKTYYRVASTSYGRYNEACNTSSPPSGD